MHGMPHLDAIKAALTANHCMHACQLIFILFWAFSRMDTSHSIPVRENTQAANAIDNNQKLTSKKMKYQ